MSWDAYISALLTTKFIHSAALIDLMDGSFWAYGGPEVPRDEEVGPLLDYVGSAAKSLQCGITINGIKYLGLHYGFDGMSHYLFFRRGHDGGCIYTTNKLLICALYGPERTDNDDPFADHPGDVVNCSECHLAVKNICVYLSNLGF